MIRVGVIASATAGTLLAATVLSTRGGAERQAVCAESLVPAYLPAHELAALAATPRLPRLLVVNPASGPGSAPHPGFREAVQAARRAGARVLGYVHTSWGRRDVAAVEADIVRYASWYGTDGVFLDEAAHDAAFVPHYRALATYARAVGQTFVALNPGVVPARPYFGLADAVVTFEGPYADYAERLETMPGWLEHVPADRIAHLVYGATREEALTLARDHTGRGRLYATAGALPDPWSRLPPYLAEEQGALGGCA
jgi:hypothetical protein